jgi:hypothetical protein
MVLKLDKETIDQLISLIDERIQIKLEEILGDPDEGLEVKEEIIERLKAQKTLKKNRIPFEEIVKEVA